MSTREVVDVVFVETNQRIRDVVMSALTDADMTCIVVSDLANTADKKGRCLIIGTPIFKNMVAYVTAITRFRIFAGPKVMVLVHQAVWKRHPVFRMLFENEYINLTPVMAGNTGGLIRKIKAMIGDSTES